MHIITPYNPWAPKKKKTWQEQMWEDQQIAETEAKMLAEASSKTLPDNAPATSVATAGGMANTMAGGGGQPVPQYFQESETVNFDRSPASGDGPVTVQFTNLTPTHQFDTYNWEFTQDGVTTTSTDVNPVVVFQTGSENPSKVTASLQATSSATGAPTGRSPDVYILVGVPTVTAAYTFTTSSNVAPFSASFTNTSTNTSQTPTTTYKWSIVNGATTYTSTATNFACRIDSGSFTASLQATGSYDIASATSSMHVATVPTFTVTLAVVTSSNYSPATVTLTPTVTYNGQGTVTGNWRSGEFSEGGTEYTLPYAGAWTNRLYDTRSGVSTQDGKFTASLSLTESVYNTRLFVTKSFALKLPTLELSFLTTSLGFGGAENSYMEPVSMSYTSSIVTEGMGGASYTFLWNFGSASFTNSQGTTAGTSTVQGPHFRSDYVPGAYTASLQVTSSVYGISAASSQSFVVSS